ncbi:MAG TPA: DUF4870 domain-containing protein [Vicinamibacterales bacterium]|jgi:uncharacterized membrane protein|nr:DUF4870 domain-containing protein [Vicinamibacterales bacterium]
MTPTNAGDASTTGLDTNLAAALSYFVGFITGIVFLLIEKNSKFVRFHAMQSTLVFGALCILWVVLQVLPILGVLVWLFIVFPLSVALWLLLMFKAFQGEKFKLPFFGDLAESKI